MLKILESVPDTLKKWKDSRGFLYRFVGSISAALVIASVMGIRPSDSLAYVSEALGLGAVADWLGSDAFPFIGTSDSSIQSAALTYVSLLFVVMVVVPIWKGWRDEHDMFLDRPNLLFGAPAASTIWVLMLVAAQQEGFVSKLLEWRDSLLTVIGWATVCFLAFGLLLVLAARFGLGDLLKLALHPVFKASYRLGVGFTASVIAVFLAAISLPLSVIGWMCSLESDEN